MDEFEWDEDKRQENIKRHGVDFARAVQIFLGPVLEAEDDRFDYEEERYLALGQARGRWYVVVWTPRGSRRRIITAWEVGRSGRRRYQALLRR